MNTDITRNKHGGNAQSEIAFERATKSGKIFTDRRKVYEAIKESGSFGLSCRELANEMGVGMNNISGRFSELKKANKIKQIGSRQNSGVCVLKEEFAF
jgi:predicted HTH transcriptional regulator